MKPITCLKRSSIALLVSGILSEIVITTLNSGLLVMPLMPYSSGGPPRKCTGALPKIELMVRSGGIIPSIVVTERNHVNCARGIHKQLRSALGGLRLGKNIKEDPNLCIRVLRLSSCPPSLSPIAPSAQRRSSFFAQPPRVSACHGWQRWTNWARRTVSLHFHERGRSEAVNRHPVFVPSI